MSVGFAKKIGMTRLFVEGKNTPVTVIQFGTNFILQKKTADKDGYNAVQVGSVIKKGSRKPAVNHVKKYIGKEVELRFISEFKNLSFDESKLTIDINDFAENDLVDISGSVIGRGFAGVVKRHGFAGQPASHGHDHERAPGSIGSRWPQRVLPGKKMAGHMGTNTVKIRQVKIVAIDIENSLIFVNGSVPGSNNSYLQIQKVVNQATKLIK
jgi:large subunit ribosomal protein L3